jgi:POT family proton-dependent oligopeptide transporter
MAPADGKEWFGHPRGLFVLFFAEMWERFSYYGMRALLIFYLVQHWLYSDQQASVIYGAYTALVYITPVIGGYLADKYLGQRKAVTFGAVLLTVGHALMAVEGDGGQNSGALNVFWLALAFIIVGSGFLKANISVIVGQLYRRTDPRRDPAYTIFYVGLNLVLRLWRRGARHAARPHRLRVGQAAADGPRRAARARGAAHPPRRPAH